MSRSDRILLAAGGAALVLTAAAGVLLLMPVSPAADADSLSIAGIPAPVGSTGAPTERAAPATIVVDVAGAVVRPGIVQLPAGTRIGDALAAAGGYASDADLDAAAASLNLAQPLTDGEQIRVPRIGEPVAGADAAPSAGTADGGPASPGSGGGANSGLVNLNTATPEELEALPGIGPVTVQKIVAARQEQPFSSLDDAVQRGIIHRGQLEDIRELATAG